MRVEDLEEEEREAWYLANPECDETSEETSRRSKGWNAIEDKFSEEKLRKIWSLYRRTGSETSVLRKFRISRSDVKGVKKHFECGVGEQEK